MEREKEKKKRKRVLFPNLYNHMHSSSIMIYPFDWIFLDAYNIYYYGL